MARNKNVANRSDLATRDNFIIFMISENLVTKASLLLLLLFATVFFPCLGQNFGENYTREVNRADSLFHERQYKIAAETYDRAFIKNGDKAYLPDRYTAASAWSMVGELDSAFYHLFRIIDRANYDELERVQSDSTFRNLRRDPRWEKAIGLIKNNKDIKEAKYNRHLIAILDTVFINDQKYRLTVYDTINRYGMKSPQVDNMNKLILEKDSINLPIITGILDHFGWPGPEVIAQHGKTIFLVLQHADLATQQKYLPIMRDAVKRNAAENSSLALLEDRVALGKGGCQIYGSQIGFHEKTNSYYVLPLSDPDHVDERRKEMGLGTLREYAAIWKISWDQDNHRKHLHKFLGRKSLRKYDCFKK